MKDSSLKLQDKNVFLVGPFNGVVQAILRSLTEFGADVALVSDSPQFAQRFCDGLNEAREVHPEYGRAAHLQMPIKTDADILEVLGRITESLGRIDSLIDASPLGWTERSTSDFELQTSRRLVEHVLPFLLAKQRGRIVYLFEDPSLQVLTQGLATESLRSDLSQMIEAFGKAYRTQNVTCNGLSIGITDDFILKLNPKTPSIKKSFEELQKKYPTIKLVEYHDVSLGAAYLCSALSASLTGQVLRLTHGFHID